MTGTDFLEKVMSRFRQGESEVEVGHQQGHVRREQRQPSHKGERVEPMTQLGSSVVPFVFLNFHRHVLFI